MVSGFMVADDRNAGGFWDGLNKIFDFPAEVVNEAVEKASGLPALLVKFMPSLIETINIALVSTRYPRICTMASFDTTLAAYS